jgi:hypothetical protein
MNHHEIPVATNKAIRNSHTYSNGHNNTIFFNKIMSVKLSFIFPEDDAFADNKTHQS